LWKECKTDFRIKVYKVAEENKKKQLEDIFKTKIAEWHLNKMGNEGNVYEI
jgi:spore coat protein CotF